MTARSYGKSMSGLVRNHQAVFPFWLLHFEFLRAKNESSCCSTSSLDIVKDLDFAHSNMYVVASSFNLQFPLATSCEELIQWKRL